MQLEEQLFELLVTKPYSRKIELIAKRLENKDNFKLTKEIDKLKGIWELR